MAWNFNYEIKTLKDQRLQLKAATNSSSGCGQPELTCYLRGCIYTIHTHATLPLYSLQKVRELGKLTLTVLYMYLTLLSCPIAAHPPERMKDTHMDGPESTVAEDGHKVTFQTTGCRPLSSEELRVRMGGAFDETKMTYDGERLKRSSSLQPDMNEDDDNDTDYDTERDFSDESDIASDSDETENVPRRKRDTDDNANLRSDTSFLYQNMLFDSILKNNSRKRRSPGSRPAWTCKKRKRWIRLDEGYFPTRILDGHCEQKSCFFGMYTCSPVTYKIKILKRDPNDACRPRPMTGHTTTYEESWTFIRKTVTVACECGIPKSS